MKLHPYIPPLNATVRTIDGLIGTVERVVIDRNMQYFPTDSGRVHAIALGPIKGEVSIFTGFERISVSIYNIRPCIRE